MSPSRPEPPPPTAGGARVPGEEDPRPRLAYDRTLLANERTLAAWIRTGLAVSAVGFAALHFLPLRAERAVLAGALGTALVFAGVGVILFGAWRFAAVNRELAGPATPAAGVRPVAVYLLAGAIALLLLGLLAAG